MPEKVTVSTELVQQLIDRIEALEKKIDDKAQKKKKKKSRKNTAAKKIADSVSDITEDGIRGCGKITGGMIDATSEALKEGADALTSLSDDIDKDKLGTLPAAIVSVMRKSIEIQRKALDKFEKSVEEYDEE